MNAGAPARRIVFAGTPDFAVPALRALADAPNHEIVAVYTQPDRPAGRGRKPAPSAVCTAAGELHLPLCQPESLRDQAAVKQLQEQRCDLMVVAAYGLILPEAALAAPRLGCWNIHASLLPRWRGAAPIERAILAGDTETGISIMQMDPGLDTGDVLLRRSTPIGPRDTAGTVHDRLAALGADTLMEALRLHAQGALSATPQPETDACYAHRLTAADRVLDWRQPAASLDRRVRALNPRRVARADLAGDDVSIWEACPLDAPAPGASPGEVVNASAAGIDVATGDGVLRLQRLQRAGRRPVSAAEYLNGRPELRR